MMRILAAERVVRLEYDYNWCRVRSPICHRVLLGVECDCQQDPAGPLARLYALIHGRAHHVFYMSVIQSQVHRQYLGTMMTRRFSVLGSCFSPATIDRILALGQDAYGPGWLVVRRWGDLHDFFKGAPNAIALAEDLGLPFKTAGGISTMSSSARWRDASASSPCQRPRPQPPDGDRGPPDGTAPHPRRRSMHTVESWSR